MDEIAIRKIKATLFDLDGTLIDSIPLIRESFRYASRKVLKKQLPDETLLANVGMPLNKQMEAINKEKAEELLQAYTDFNHKYHDKMVTAYPGIHDLLDRLKARGVKVGVVTSKSRWLAMRGIEVSGIASMIDCLVAADDVDNHKPHPEPIFECMERLRCFKNHAVFVGDSPYDIQAAKLAGLYSIAVPFGPFSEERLMKERPDRIAHNLDELKAILFEGIQDNNY